MGKRISMTRAVMDKVRTPEISTQVWHIEKALNITVTEFLLISSNLRCFFHHLMFNPCQNVGVKWDNLVFSNCYANLANVCMWWLEDCQTSSLVNALCILGVGVWCISLWMHLHINMWKISFIKIKKYAFTDSFGNHLTITYSFGKLAIRQTSFRRKKNRSRSRLCT